MTRPERASERFLRICPRVERVKVIISPIIRIAGTGAEFGLDGINGLIITSANALPFVPPTRGMTAFCVGDRTAEAAREAGLEAVSAQGDADALVALIRRSAPKGPLLHLRGEDARGDVASRLTAAGIETHEAVVYRSEPRDLSAEARVALAGRAPVVLPVFSPRSASLLSAAAREATAPLWLAALSPAVAQAWSGPVPARIEIAETPDAKGMCAALARLFNTASG